MNVRQRLQARGVVVGAVPAPDAVHPLVRVEAPVYLNGNLDLSTQVEVGAFSGTYGCSLRHAVVGRYCSIAQGAQVGLDSHPTDWLTTSMLGYVEGVHGWAGFVGATDDTLRAFSGGYRSVPGLTMIGHDVWIGHGAYVRAGVTLGDGCIVGAGSSVVSDVPPYAVAAGSPARVVRERHPLSTIADLLRIQPWRFNLYDVPVEHVRDPAGFVAWYDAEGHELLVPYEPGWVGAEELSDLARLDVRRKRRAQRRGVGES